MRNISRCIGFVGIALLLTVAMTANALAEGFDRFGEPPKGTFNAKIGKTELNGITTSGSVLSFGFNFSVYPIREKAVLDRLNLRLGFDFAAPYTQRYELYEFKERAYTFSPAIGFDVIRTKHFQVTPYVGGSMVWDRFTVSYFDQYSYSSYNICGEPGMEGMCESKTGFAINKGLSVLVFPFGGRDGASSKFFVGADINHAKEMGMYGTIGFRW